MWLWCKSIILKSFCFSGDVCKSCKSLKLFYICSRYWMPLEHHTLYQKSPFVIWNIFIIKIFLIYFTRFHVRFNDVVRDFRLNVIVLRKNFTWRFCVILLNFRQLQVNGTLEFPSFSSQFYRSDIHDQIYRCQAANQAGTIISRNIHVRAIVHQFYDLKVDGHEVLLNNVAFLKCVVPLHIREHVEITTWYRGEEIVTDNSDISE